MRISVFGLGYVGSVSATCLTTMGHEVIGVDTNAEKVLMVNAGQSPVVEPRLPELLAQAVRTGRLRATTTAAEATTASELALICVGTPSKANGQPDFSALCRVAQQIGQALRQHPKPYQVVIRSTVPPGTSEEIVLPELRGAAGLAGPSGIRLAVNPEFMREGAAIQDFHEPPFTLVGSNDTRAVDALRGVYAQVSAPFVSTEIRTAEMVKYVSNTFHALKVCFANEIADVCTGLGADPQEVMRIFLTDRKLNVSEAYLRPGFAFGGSCLPKDVRALVHAARTLDVAGPLLSAILPSNESQIRRGIEAVLQTSKRRIGVVGLSFKPGTDDLRESPMVLLVEALIGKGCDVRILDRNVSAARLVGANRRYIEEEIPHISALLCDGVEALLAHAEVLVIGNSGADAVDAVARARPDHTVIDLTRSSRP